MDWSAINPLTSEEALKKREEWERLAPNAGATPDIQVLAFIQEIRGLRHYIYTRPTVPVMIVSAPPKPDLTKLSPQEIKITCSGENE